MLTDGQTYKRTKPNPYITPCLKQMQKMYLHLYVLTENYQSKGFVQLFFFKKICGHWLLKTEGCLIQCKICRIHQKILYWSLSADGCLFQMVVRTGLTVMLKFKTVTEYLLIICS